jgi:hypothetical protein
MALLEGVQTDETGSLAIHVVIMQQFGGLCYSMSKISSGMNQKSEQAPP